MLIQKLEKMKQQIIQDQDRAKAFEEYNELNLYYDCVVASQFFFDPISENWVGVINYYE